MKETIRHIAGEYSDGLQICIICGAVITDNTKFLHDPRRRGLSEGEIFVTRDDSGATWMKTHEGEFKNCNE
jgi:hypothetical protein